MEIIQENVERQIETLVAERDAFMAAERRTINNMLEQSRQLQRVIEERTAAANRQFAEMNGAIKVWQGILEQMPVGDQLQVDDDGVKSHQESSG